MKFHSKSMRLFRRLDTQGLTVTDLFRTTLFALLETNFHFLGWFQWMKKQHCKISGWIDIMFAITYSSGWHKNNIKIFLTEYHNINVVKLRQEWLLVLSYLLSRFLMNCHYNEHVEFGAIRINGSFYPLTRISTGSVRLRGGTPVRPIPMARLSLLVRRREDTVHFCAMWIDLRMLGWISPTPGEANWGWASTRHKGDSNWRANLPHC